MERVGRECKLREEEIKKLRKFYFIRFCFAAIFFVGCEQISLNVLL